MIKRFALFLVLVLLLSFVPERALLAQVVRPIVAIEPAEQGVQTGATFTIDVVIEEAVDLGGYEFQVSFSASVLEVTKVEEGGYLGSTGRRVFPVNPEIDNEVGTVRYGVASVGGPAGPDGSGKLATLTFEAVGPGTTELHLHQVLIADTDVAQQVPRVRHGEVTVGSEGGPTDQATEVPVATATWTPSPIPTEASTGGPSPTPTASSTDAATAAPTSATSPTPSPIGTTVPASTGAPSPTPVETPFAGETDQPGNTATATEEADEDPAATLASSGSESAADTGSPRPAPTASETIPSPTSAGEAAPQGEDEVGTATEQTPTSSGTSGAGTRPPLERIVLLGLVPVLIAGGVYLMVFLPRRLLRQGQGGDGGGKDG